MSDTTLQNCIKCGYETDCIEGVCQECALKASNEKLVEANEIYLDILKDTMKRLLKSKCPHALAAIMWIGQAIKEAGDIT